VHQRDLKLAVIVSLPFEENTYVANWSGRNDCLVFDPGLEPDKIFDYLDQHALSPAAIINTHGHADHIAGNGAIKERWPSCPLVIGAGDAPMLTDGWLNLSRQYGEELVSPPADELLRDGQTYAAAGFELEVSEIPGHSPGHIVLVLRQVQPYVVFAGDVLFSGSVGRTDFPGGSLAALVRGIHTRLFVLPDDTVVLPGHGPATTIGAEKRSNPFVGRPAGYRGE
jgi:glyoxylase-like metal-dependent hydrolase (beta-lactamase superfamily II)